VAEAERELEEVARELEADELATLVAKIAPVVSEERAAHWVRQTIEAGGRQFTHGDSQHVLERIAPYLSLEQAQTYLVQQIVPAVRRDFLELHRAKDRELPLLYVGHKALTAGALARRMATLGKAEDAFELLRLARTDEITSLALVEVAPYLRSDQVRFVDECIGSASLSSLTIASGIGWTGLGDSTKRYLQARLAPSLTRIGEVGRALEYTRAVDSEWRASSYLGIAEASRGQARSDALLEALSTVLE